MDIQTYEGLIRQLEAQSENNPAWFRSKVFLLTSCAYVVFVVYVCVANWVGLFNV